MILNIRYQAYRLPLVSAWPGGSDIPMKQRRGWIIRIGDGGFSGLGDCAPFPAMGSESHAAAAETLGKISNHQWNTASLLELLEEKRHVFPATCHGLETALLDLESHKQGIPLRKLLVDSASDTVQVNAMGGSIRQAQSDSAIQQGYQIIKLKAGIQSVTEETTCLKQLCARLPTGLKLRLDANQRWTLDQARRFLDAVAGLPIESIEEPLATPHLADLARLQAHTPLTLALDESLSRLDMTEILAAPAIRRLIIKPTLLGGLQASYTLAEKVRSAKKECVVTTTLESAVGVHACCHLAAAVDSLNPGLAHGLATSEWLRQNTAEPPLIDNGQIQLRDRPGLGIDEKF